PRSAPRWPGPAATSSATSRTTSTTSTARTADPPGGGTDRGGGYGRLTRVTTADALTGAGVSEREAEVLALVGDHLTNAEISARLFISVRTVESHVSSLLRKLGVSDRRALAELAGDHRASQAA